jgi:hypothetical protein
VKKFLLLGAMALASAGLLATAAPAAARDFKCNGVFAGATVGNVVVPPNGACTLAASSVKGNVSVRRGAYFEAENTRIGGNVQGSSALTVFIHGGSRIGGNVQGDKTPQLFLFDSTVVGDIQAQDAVSDFGHVQICGMTVVSGNIQIKKMGTDILIGEVDPLVGCAPNTVQNGDVQAEENFTDVEFVIRGNAIPNGNLQVFKNRGPSEKFVEFNTGGESLQCKENDSSFVGSPNTGWKQTEGQCS